MDRVYKVCIPHTHRDDFDYLAEGLTPVLGARVWVPFRNQRRLGIITKIESSTSVAVRLKSIEAVIDDQPLLDESVLSLCSWIANYYQSPLSEVLPLALPKKYRLGEIAVLPQTEYFSLVVSVDEAIAGIPARARKQKELVEFLSHATHPMAKKGLIQAGFITSQIRSLLDSGTIQQTMQLEWPISPIYPMQKPLTLHPEQGLVKEKILEGLSAYQCFLLQGVTGSGKTEIYLQVIQEVLAQGKQVLILVPEIGLTPQLVQRFSQRFAEPIAVIHSHLNESERQIAWQLAKDNRVKILIGTRAAVFTPLPTLGLIIIDEEHDSSLKQMEGVRYSARDTALMRAHLANIPIILGSATPSLESLHNAIQNKYTLLRLTHRAVSTTPLQYQLLDIRNLTLHHGLAEPTLALIGEHLKRGNQVLVFINRRGFSPVLLCHQCGWMADCRACDTHLTLHKKAARLMCHHCGLMQPIPSSCKRCHSKELLPIGAGTQRIHEYLQAYFPTTRVVRIDRDEVRGKYELDTQLERIQKGETQLIVGTQMLAKGHHFPMLSLVVVVDTDAGFYNQDFRAVERLGQLLVQVAGRAGREEIEGHVLIQTHIPQHPLLNSLIQQGYDEFAKELLTSRKLAALPPYHYLAIIRAQSKTQARVLQFLHATKEQITIPHLAIMGPAPAPLPKKADQHRMQLLIKSPTRKLLKSALTEVREWLAFNKITNGVRWNVDVDPVDLS